MYSLSFKEPVMSSEHHYGKCFVEAALKSIRGKQLQRKRKWTHWLYVSALCTISEDHSQDEQCPGVSICQCTVRTLKMAVLLGSIQALVNLYLLHPHPTHITDLPHTCPRPQLRLDQNISTEIAYQRGVEGHVPPLLVSLITKSQLQVNSPDNWHPPPHFPQ